MGRDVGRAVRGSLCLALLLWLPLAAEAQGPDIRMQRVVARFVEQTGGQVLGVGSWIGGKGFDAATSDFDMRIVLNGGDAASQATRWREAQRQLRVLIQAEFGDGARSILSRTNLYPPNQLMQGVEDAADALDRFRQLRTVPNLGYEGSVTSSTPARFAEGLYGPGAPTYVQGYERAAGRVFYSNNGTCVTGLSELVHLGEGPVPGYTARGTANTAGQWAEHALEEIAAGRGDKVAKYLERLERDLIKSRDLSRLPLDDAFRQELRDMRALLARSPGELTSVADDVARLVTRGRAEAAILAGFDEAGPIRRAYLRVMLDGVAAKNKLGELIGRALKQAPDWVTAGNVMNFLVVAAATPSISQAIARGDSLETIGAVCEHFKWVTSFGPLLLGEITVEIMREAEASGYAAAAGSQNAWDLMEGIYTAWGRCGVDPDGRRKLTLADMVTNFKIESKLDAVVRAQAVRASTRGLGEATAKADAGLAEAIYAECWPVIREAWRWERDCLTSEYLMLASQVVHTPILIYYDPRAPRVGQAVICEARSLDGKLGERLTRMREIIRILYGRGALIATSFRWEPTGQEAGDHDWRRSYTFDEAGSHPVKVRLEIQPYAQHPETEPRVMLTRVVGAAADVVVGGGEKATICPSCGEPLGTNPNCMDCVLHAHDPTNE